MAHKIAKLMLENAGTFLDRAKAVETALSMGMPLSEIEGYLDWLDMVKPDQERGSPQSPSTPHSNRRRKAE